jgi:hypothetical protein
MIVRRCGFVPAFTDVRPSPDGGERQRDHGGNDFGASVDAVVFGDAHGANATVSLVATMPNAPGPVVNTATVSSSVNGPGGSGDGRRAEFSARGADVADGGHGARAGRARRPNALPRTRVG